MIRHIVVLGHYFLQNLTEWDSKSFKLIFLVLLLLGNTL